MPVIMGVFIVPGCCFMGMCVEMANPVIVRMFVKMDSFAKQLSQYIHAEADKHQPDSKFQ